MNQEVFERKCPHPGVGYFCNIPCLKCHHPCMSHTWEDDYGKPSCVHVSHGGKRCPCEKFTEPESK